MAYKEGAENLENLKTIFKMATYSARLENTLEKLKIEVNYKMHAPQKRICERKFKREFDLVGVFVWRAVPQKL